MFVKMYSDTEVQLATLLDRPQLHCDPGGEIPARITGVWIIGVSLFGLQQAEALFANAVVVDNGKTHELM